MKIIGYADPSHAVPLADQLTAVYACAVQKNLRGIERVISTTPPLLSKGDTLVAHSKEVFKKRRGQKGDVIYAKTKSEE